MLGRARAILMAAAAAMLSLSAPAGAQDDLAERIISVPDPGAYRVDGTPQSARVRNDPGVQFGRALRVAVSGRGEHSWAVSVAVPVNRAVAAGDNLVLAFWARLERGEGGATGTTLPYNAVQLAAAPYTALFTGGVEIGPEWRMHEIRGRADRAYAAGELNVSLHLATGRQTVDIGPVFLLNMGQGN